jgi:hypothetical protein
VLYFVRSPPPPSSSSSTLPWPPPYGQVMKAYNKIKEGEIMREVKKGEKCT